MTTSRVLIVDDDPALLEALPEALRLRMDGLTVDTCDSGPAALERIAATDYDAIVSDIKMPGMDGLQLLEAVRSRRPDTPTLLITGHGEHELAVKALRGGAYDFVQKPIDRDYFVASLNRAIQRCQLGRQLEEQKLALERHADELERTVQERTRELREANRAKDELVRREQAARSTAEQAEQRAAFLAEASTVLAASLDYETTLKSVAQLAVPRFSDWCAVDVVEEEGITRRLAMAHVDPAKVELAKELDRRYPVDPNEPRGVPQVLRSGRSELYAAIPPELLVTSARDAEHLRLLRELGHKSAMIVPLVARGRTFGALSFISAESDRRYGPEDLALAEDLARRAAVAVDNARLYRQAQQAVAARDEFLSIASHELKTPLTALQAHIQLLLRAVQQGRTVPPEQAERRLQAAEQASKRLVQLIEDLLDVSRIGAGRLALEPEDVDLAGLACEVAARAAPQLAEAGCRLQLRAGEAVVGRWDRLRLEQVVTNLLANAIKYGRGRPIELSVTQRGGRAQLMMRDHGIGIAPKEVDRIFGRFERAASARHYGGLGLGLYIARQIVAAHGGAIRVDSRPDEGATFTVELPTHQPSAVSNQRSALSHRR